MMGRAAAAADHTIVTSDNPRTEDPVGVIHHIEEGCERPKPPTRS